MAPNDTNSSIPAASNDINTKSDSIVAPITASLRGKPSTKKSKRQKLNLSRLAGDYGDDIKGRGSPLDLDFGSSLQSSQSEALNESNIDYLDGVDDYLNDVCDHECYASNSDFNSSYDAYDSCIPYDADHDFPAAYNSGRSSKDGDTRPTGKYTNKGLRRILANVDKTPKMSEEGKQAGKKSDHVRVGRQGGKKKRG